MREPNERRAAVKYSWPTARHSRLRLSAKQDGGCEPSVYVHAMQKLSSPRRFRPECSSVCSAHLVELIRRTSRGARR